MAIKKKTFDAVAQSCRWRQATSRLLNTMTPEEQLAFLNRRLTEWAGSDKSKSTRALPRRPTERAA